MKISTKGRYALRLMLDLAMQDSNEYIPLKQIGERQSISIKYLEQIINILVRAGYVKGVRGSKGGYKLAGSPEDYTVGMVLRLTEGSLAPVSCVEDEVNTCPRSNECMTLPVWQKLNQAVSNVIDNITLADIIKHSQSGDDYII
jgi:Rrf2 family protein